MSNRERDDGRVSRRHLLLLRHAKSSWDDLGLADHDRPLSRRGERALPRILEHLAATATRPELAICSTARRTVQTLDGVRDTLAPDATISIEDGIYLAEAPALLARLRRIDRGVRSALLVGHNPGMEDLANVLVGSGDAAIRQELATKYPTGALAHLTFRGSWTDLAPGAARLDGFFVPRPPRTDT